MPKSPKRHRPNGTRAAVTRSAKPNPEKLEAEREALLRRLEALEPRSRDRPGYGSALKLLNQKFRLATVSARLGILQAADFMIGVLEKLPLN
jgi:hypothetical protein